MLNGINKSIICSMFHFYKIQTGCDKNYFIIAAIFITYNDNNYNISDKHVLHETMQIFTNSISRYLSKKYRYLSKKYLDKKSCFV